MLNNTLNSEEYLKVTYSEELAPYGSYPSQLANHLYEQHYKRPGSILDLGCGRGEYLKAFADLGFLSRGVDISPAALQYNHGFDVKIINLEEEVLEYKQKFDFIFSKSVIEHMQNPLSLVKAAYDLSLIHN